MSQGKWGVYKKVMFLLTSLTLLCPSFIQRSPSPQNSKTVTPSPREIFRETRKKLFSFPQKRHIKPCCLKPGSFWFIRNLLNEHSTSFLAPRIIYSPLFSQKIHNPNMQLCKLKKWILSCILRVTPPGIKLGIKT